MPATPVVYDDFGQYDIIDLRISMMDPHPKGFASDDPAMRLINAMEKEIERLQRRCEIYASGLTAIAYPLEGYTAGVLVRTAINTLRRIEKEGCTHVNVRATPPNPGDATCVDCGLFLTGDMTGKL